MNLSNIKIVLVATSHPGNIGSSARAMKTMGLNNLSLVMPKLFPDKHATELASGADDLLNHAQICTSLEQSLTECQLVIGTSARPRDLALPGLTPKTCADMLKYLSSNTKVAIVFGRERTGLTNEELLHCHYHLIIPSNADYASLNLAQAVQIVAYELRMAIANQVSDTRAIPENLASYDELAHGYAHLWHILEHVDFLKPTNAAKVKQRIKRLFNRVLLTKQEIQMLRGILTQIDKKIVTDE